jgi:hypothetical protein
MQKLLSGAGEEPIAEEDAPLAQQPAPDAWRPEPLFRTCLSSLADSNAFGRQMEVEADARGFYHAQKKAFVWRTDEVRAFLAKH